MLDLGNEINHQSDDINDFVIFGGDDDIPQDEVVPEYFPTSLAGNTPFSVQEDTDLYHSVSGHVIMNQCGSLLNRNDKEIIGYRSQKYFLQIHLLVVQGN